MSLHRRGLRRLFAVGLLSVSVTAFIHGQAAPVTTNSNAGTSTTSDSDAVVTLETLEVNGSFSGSLAAATQLKQQSQSITEVIAAEDIGKLPDVSIADSLTRLTGLTTQRTNGRSQQISIRGLTGDFSTGMLNGREQVSTSLNRAVEFDQYPAELLNQVVVYKTASADLTSQGLAGTIDLETVKPLSKSGRVVAVNAYYEWTQLSRLTPGVSGKGNRFNFSYVDQFADGKVGFALGYSHSSKPFEGQQFQAWGYPTDADGNFALGGTKSYVRTSNLDRDGLMAVLEFRPNEQIHSTIDVYASGFEEKQYLRGMEIPLAFWSSASLQPGYTVTDGLITNATLTNVQPVVRNDAFLRNDTPIAVGWNLKIGEQSEWPVTFDVGYSRVSRKDQNLETYSGLGFRGAVAAPNTPDTVNVQLIPGNIPVVTTTLDYADGSLLRLTDPQGWGGNNLPGGGMEGYLKYFRAKDELGQFKLSTEHRLDGFFSKVEVGTSYTDRYKRDGEGPSGFITAADAQPGVEKTQPLPEQIGTTDMSYLGLGEIYAYDPLKAFNSGTWGFTPNNDTGIIANRYEVREKISQFYTQLDMNGQWGDLPVSGNVGFRIINVDQSSKGLSANGNVLTPVSAGEKYTQFAPDLNLTFKAAEQTFIRFSLARQIARPRMYDMRASRSWGFDAAKANNTDPSQSPWSGGGGNGTLRPWVSDSADISIERYFSDNRGYVSLAGFYKDLRNYIYQQNIVGDFSDYPVPAGSEPALQQGIISTPVNGQGGTLKGLEFTLSLPSEIISRNVRGFGVVLGGAYTDSSVKPWGPDGGDAPIAGLSKRVANITVYFERKGFSARVSDRYRSSNRQYITTFGVPNPGGDVNPNGGFSVAQPENVIDAQVSYTFQNNVEALKGMTLFLQAYNLNNEPLVTYNNNDPRQVINYQKYGASYSAGVSYKF